MNLLRQATSQIIRFGPFLDSTDGNTEETALTISQSDMLLSKDGGAYAQKNAAGNATHDTGGNYSTTLNTTDTATLGILKLYIHVSGALAVWESFSVITAASYDAFVTNGYNDFDATSDTVANVTTVATTTTNTDMVGTDNALLASSAPTNFGALGISAGGAVDDVTLVATTTNNTDMRGTDNASSQASVNIVDANVDAILVDTGTTIPATLATLSTQASVNTIDGNVDDILLDTTDILVDTSTTIPAQITALNDVAATDIVSSGAITTSSGSVVTVDNADIDKINGTTVIGAGTSGDKWRA
jgi:hypothetical protein